MPNLPKHARNNWFQLHKDLDGLVAIVEPLSDIQTTVVFPALRLQDCKQSVLCHLHHHLQPQQHLPQQLHNWNFNFCDKISCYIYIHTYIYIVVCSIHKWLKLLPSGLPPSSAPPSPSSASPSSSPSSLVVGADATSGSVGVLNNQKAISER